MTLSELIQAVRDNPQSIIVPASWGQGRAGFGGLAAALVYETMRAQVPHDRPVRSLAITFVGPLQVDTPVSFEAEVLREGKAVSQVLGRAVQNGQVVTLVQGSFGAARNSVVTVEAEPAPSMPALEACQELPYIAGAVLPHLKSFAPGSSLTWTIEFVQPQPQVDTHDWCQYRAVIEHARDGYGHCAAALWSAQGELLALSRQTVTVFG